MRPPAPLLPGGILSSIHVRHSKDTVNIALCRHVDFHESSGRVTGPHFASCCQTKPACYTLPSEQHLLFFRRADAVPSDLHIRMAQGRKIESMENALLRSYTRTTQHYTTQVVKLFQTLSDRPELAKYVEQLCAHCSSYYRMTFSYQAVSR